MVRQTAVVVLLSLSLGLNAFLLGQGRISPWISRLSCVSAQPQRPVYNASVAVAASEHCVCQQCQEPPPCPGDAKRPSGKFRQVAFYDMPTVFPQLQMFGEKFRTLKAGEWTRFNQLGKPGEVHSQWSQEFHVASYLNCKRNGFFVDLAANIAIDNSNTLTLERDFGWNGILIEANPTYWWGLLHRNASLFLGPVGAEDEKVTFQLHDETSGIVGENFDAKPKKEWKETLSYTTTSLASVLRQFGAPSQIDFLSLDVEGAESLVMKNFPWDTYTFSVLNVERPKPDLKQWLGDNGYVLLRSNPSWDETYIHRSIPDFEAVKAKWTGNGNIDLPTGCMDALGYEHPWNAKWPPPRMPRHGGLPPLGLQNPMRKAP